MTQEEKDLLLKDLCARLQYGVVVGYKHYTDRHIVTTKLTGIRGGLYYDADGQIPDNELKPYLRPLSSMTEEEEIEWFESVVPTMDCDKQLDFYCKYHFDYRGLIEKGLAIEAPKGMYNF